MDDEPNLYMGNTRFTKHPLKIGCLGFLGIYTLKNQMFSVKIAHPLWSDVFIRRRCLLQSSFALMPQDASLLRGIESQYRNYETTGVSMEVSN